MIKMPFVSVVLCTYNSGNNLIESVQSIINQSYPKDLFEIIVVDDASTDNSLQGISKLDLRIIRHTQNKGVASARNTGLFAAAGSIIAYTDDDCIVDTNWLSELVKQYSNEGVIGVGGLTIPYSTNTLTEKYMAASGYGNPAPIEFRLAKSIVSRFFVYMRDMVLPVTSQSQVVKVQDIYTLNSSFRKDALLSIDGFDTDLLWSEDVDLCHRLSEQYPEDSLIFTPKAQIKHKNRTKFLTYIRQIYLRSAYTYKYYSKINKIIPIFPFPVFYILSIIVLAIYFPSINIISIFLTPFLLYFWWPIRAIREGDLDYISFPYMQIVFETTSLFGLARGYILTKLKRI